MKTKRQGGLGIDDIVEIDCNACTEGYGPPRGYINVRGYVSDIKFVTITGKEITENLEGKSIEYRYNDNYIIKEGGYFYTKELADIKLRELIEDAIRYNRSMYNSNRKGKIMSLSWSIRYHTNEAKECKKNMDRHLDKVKYIKSINQ